MLFVHLLRTASLKGAAAAAAAIEPSRPGVNLEKATATDRPRARAHRSRSTYRISLTHIKIDIPREGRVEQLNHARYQWTDMRIRRLWLPSRAGMARLAVPVNGMMSAFKAAAAAARSIVRVLNNAQQ